MTRILVAEDSRTQAAGIKYLLEHDHYEVELAADGLSALRSIDRSRPDVVLTDLQMPEMDGLQLVEAIRRRHPSLPVVLMTGEGSEEMAVEALKRGAAGFVPKNHLQHGLERALKNVLSVVRAEPEPDRLSRCLTQLEWCYQLENDESLIAPLAARVNSELARLELCDTTGAMRVAIAVAEALDNAIRHGNLELNPQLREQDAAAYEQLARQRRTEPPYRDRRVHVQVRLSPSEAVCVIRDEGPGFDLSTLNQVADPANLVRLHGRGLIVMRHLVDSVQRNTQGNEVRLVKQRDPVRATVPQGATRSD